jgi:hypothetical protein
MSKNQTRPRAREWAKLKSSEYYTVPYVFLFYGPRSVAGPFLLLRAARPCVSSECGAPACA